MKVYKVSLNQAGMAWMRRSKILPKEVNTALNRSRNQIENSLKLRTVNAGKVDLGGYLRGWRVVVESLKLKITNVAPHAKYVEGGRRPGTPPPASALYGWCQRKLGDWRLAYPVARAIGRRGIKPTPIATGPTFQTRAREIFMAEMQKANERSQKASRGR